MFRHNNITEDKIRNENIEFNEKWINNYKLLHFESKVNLF